MTNCSNVSLGLPSGRRASASRSGAARTRRGSPATAAIASRSRAAWPRRVSSTAVWLRATRLAAGLQDAAEARAYPSTGLWRCLDQEPSSRSARPARSGSSQMRYVGSSTEHASSAWTRAICARARRSRQRVSASLPKKTIENYSRGAPVGPGVATITDAFGRSAGGGRIWREKPTGDRRAYTGALARALAPPSSGARRHRRARARP